MFGGDNGAQQDNSMAQGQSMMPVQDDSMGVPATNMDSVNQAAASMPDNSGMLSSTDTSSYQSNPVQNPVSSQSARGRDAAVPEDLINIKQEALQSLRPLVGHLDQSPEEKFRTTMMMIQASDDQNLIPDAYDAAKQIEDEKARAQALLDIVNEINYFTAQNTQS